MPRRFSGPVADELAVLCRPAGRSPDAAYQAEEVYRALAACLATQQASFAHLVSETLFLRDIRHDLPLVLDIRRRLVADLGQGACAPLPACIQQAPLAQGVRLELTAMAVVPHHRGAWSVHDRPAASSCACAGCAESGARLVRLGDDTSLYTTNVYGAGGDACEQAWNMFGAAERLLDACGMDFHDVVRTWIHLRDIDRDYDALNRARRAFFRQRGLAVRPASTGVQGMPSPDGHDVSMVLQAVRSPRSRDVAPMVTPLLNEAWTYGVDFSRGLRVADANKVTLFVSGTASIDEGGRTVHTGDVAAQAERMLANMASLLAQRGATFEDVLSAVVYVENPADASRLRAVCERRGFDGFPCAWVQARLCRAELRCEAEAVAMLPLSRPRA